MGIVNKTLMSKIKNATWFMIVDGNKRDLFLNNERDEILQKYGEREISKCVGMGNQPYDEADTVKIVLL